MSDERQLENALHQAMLNRAALKRRVAAGARQLTPSALRQRASADLAARGEAVKQGIAGRLSEHRWHIAAGLVLGAWLAIFRPFRRNTGDNGAAPAAAPEPPPEPAPAPPAASASRLQAMADSEPLTLIAGALALGIFAAILVPDGDGHAEDEGQL